MPFDPAIFEAEIALKLIPTERLPAIAQDAMEAGFDGPHVVRMAILDPRYGWEIDRALPAMFSEIGCEQVSAEEAALRLARQRAKRILASGEDPLESLSYFYRLWLAADHSSELCDLGNLDDAFSWMTRQEVRVEARKLLYDLIHGDNGDGAGPDAGFGA